MIDTVSLKRRVDVGEYGNAVRPQMLIQQTITQDRADKTNREKCLVRRKTVED